MSATISTHPEAPLNDGWPALRALARAEAKRFARHPLFLLGVALMLIPMVAVLWQQELDANPMAGALFIAFLFGVFGFIVAHRLTTSLLRTRDLAGTTPVGRQQRTLALCLACLVPATAGWWWPSSCWSPQPSGRRSVTRSPRTSPGSGTTRHRRAGHPDRDGARSPHWVDLCSAWPWRGGRRSGARP